MTYHLFGHLCGLLCENCRDDLAGATVRLYRPEDPEQVPARAVANPKHTHRILEGSGIEEKSSRLLAETQADGEGRFAFSLGEEEEYEGGAVEIDVFLASVPGMPEGRDRGPVQLSITTLQPEWRQGEKGPRFGWEYCIPERFWCAIRELFGIWTICGQVTVCDSGQPVGRGATVTAFDRDWIQDDELGSDTTDGNGRFRIDYLREDFEPGTFIDVELIGGPDLYFHVESPAGQPLLIEDPSQGRTGDRENVGPCFCVDLCVPEEPPNGDDPESYPAFTHVGGFHFPTQIDSAPAGSGETLGSGRAFFRNLRLNGVVSKEFKGGPMEYKFQYREIDAAGNPVSPGAGWTDVTPSQIAKTTIGTLEEWAPTGPADPNPIKTRDYIIAGSAGPNEVAATFNGNWVEVPQETGIFSAPGSFVPNGNQIQLNSRTLASFTPNVDLTGIDAGESAAPSGVSLVENRHFEIRMRSREKGNPGSVETTGHLQHIAVNNRLYDYDRHPNWMLEEVRGGLAVSMINIREIGSGGCGEITDALTVEFTAAHPNLGNVSIGMKGPGGPYSIAVPDPATDPDVHGSMDENWYGETDEIDGGSVDVTDLQSCSYILTLSVQALLTTGDSVPDDIHDQISFCKA